MPNPIEINYQNNQGNIIELIDILKSIKKSQKQYSRQLRLVWSILELEAMGDLSGIWERGVLDLEENIRELPQGYILSWQILFSLAKKLDEVINTVIVGCHETKQIPSLKDYLGLYHPCEIVIELIDSSVWRIYAEDQEILNHLQHEFSDLAIADFVYA